MEGGSINGSESFEDMEILDTSVKCAPADGF
jgi:hypothetical protein